MAMLGACAVVAGCGGVADTLARDAAKRSVNPVLAERFPGVPLEPASDCVIDNASGGEITQLAMAAARPTLDPETSALVVEIATRPATIRCLATDGLSPFLIQGGTPWSN
jgi:hypothetical protein